MFSIFGSISINFPFSKSLVRILKQKLTIDSVISFLSLNLIINILIVLQNIYF